MDAKAYVEVDGELEALVEGEGSKGLALHLFLDGLYMEPLLCHLLFGFQEER